MFNSKNEEADLKMKIDFKYKKKKLIDLYLHKNLYIIINFNIKVIFILKFINPRSTKK